jgi:aminoglycoside 2'-N-acetyltransferase I
MPAITIYPSNDSVPPLVACQIRDFIRITWFDAFQFDLRAPLMPDEWHPVHVVLAEQDVVFSYAGVVWQMMQHDGETYKMYGLSSVFTYPAFRRKGYGAQVVEAASARIAQDSAADIAVLFTDAHLAPFYAPGGWKAVPDITIQTGDPAAPTDYDAFTMMRFLSPKGKAAREVFAGKRVYFAEYAW